SNDDLLEILGQGKDPNAVQPHLKKCFDNLHRLELTLQGPEHRKHYHAIGMYAGDGEYVPFAGPVVVEGPVEMWLTDIESMMRRTLQNQLGQTLQAYTHAKRDRWLRDWPGQCLITASLINWEIVGASGSTAQTNVFFRGVPETGVWGRTHDVGGQTEETHIYTIDWKPDVVVWSIDGKEVRRHTKAGSEYESDLTRAAGYS
ncbi:hypothetical protein CAUPRSCDRAFT_13091, partial [Caulochytrium protostelioides]